MYQVTIVGAGPAGAYLAYLLAKQGVHVLLLEKEFFPRRKPCAGGITDKVIRLVDFDLKPLIEDSIDTFVVSHRLADPITVQFARPIVYTVCRERFDALLVDEARAAGAEIREGERVHRIDIAGRDVSVYTAEGNWRGRLLVGADGGFSFVARATGLADERKLAVTLENHVTASPEQLSKNRGIIKADFGAIPSGYAWVFPKTDHLSVGVGILSRRIKGEKLRVALAQLAQVEGLADSWSSENARGWVVPTCLKPKALHGQRVLVVGDAAGVADPLTGEGIFEALYSARIAADVITEQLNQSEPDLARYTRLVREKLGPEMLASHRLARWFYLVPGLVHFLARRAKLPTNEIAQLMAGEITYSQFAQCCRRLPRLFFMPT